MSRPQSGGARVTAVVVTFNRKDLLLECLEGLARQTHPLDRVLLVDNASTDGTVAAVEASGFGERLPLELLQLTRNGGGSEGFSLGVEEALRGEPDWIWLMDDDCEPTPESLERLLASPRAADPQVGCLAPMVRLPDGTGLPLHRGHIVKRLFRAPMQALLEHEYAHDEYECGFASFVGPLFRASVAREMGPPVREMFIRFEDLEYSARLRNLGYRLWLVTPSVVLHKEPYAVTETNLRTYWRHFRTKLSFEEQWKNLYGMRNILWAGRRQGFVTLAAALSYVAVGFARTLIFDARKLRTMYLIALYAYDGRRGLFRSVAPRQWAALGTTKDPVGYLNEHSLRYDRPVTEPVRRISAPAARPTPAG